MMRKFMLQWPCVSIALLLALSFAVRVAPAAPIPSEFSPSLLSSDAAAVFERLQTLGLDADQARRRLAELSLAETRGLARGPDRFLIGAGEEKKVLGVAAVIVIAVAAITGFYLFYNSR